MDLRGFLFSPNNNRQGQERGVCAWNRGTALGINWAKAV